MAAADRAGGDHSSTLLVGVRRGCELDRMAIAVQLDDERSVVQVAPSPMLSPGCDGLEDPAVEADGATTRAEWKPIELQDCRLRRLHCCLADRYGGPSSAARRPVTRRR
jgi:hypothetical protein